MQILITGASGLVGLALVPFLRAQGHHVRRLQHSKSDQPSEDSIHWDPAKGQLDLNVFDNCDAIINLAGENIGSGRWTKRKKSAILSSRLQATSLICKAIADLKNPPKVMINASAAGYYGDQGEVSLDESNRPGEGFLADVCEKWEASALAAKERGVRVVLLRFGVILAREGGALKAMLPPFKFGLGGPLGSGKQYISWIAIDDVLRIISDVLNNNGFEGAVNVVSPHPVTNDQLTKSLGKILHRPTALLLPAFMVRLIFGQLGDELLLSSTRALPKKLLESNYHFLYPELDGALKHLITE